MTTRRRVRPAIVVLALISGLLCSMLVRAPATDAAPAEPQPIVTQVTTKLIQTESLCIDPLQCSASSGSRGYVGTSVVQADPGLALSPSNPSWVRTTELSQRSLQMTYSTGRLAWGVQPRSDAARSATTLGSAAANLRRNGSLVCTPNYQRNTEFPTYNYHSSCAGFDRGDTGELNFGVTWMVGDTSWLYTTQITFTT